ncbi:hypothetical protein [Persicobacter diffluens]|uniref:Uncharacterized protein n=1 Tax=Persicobacter diffluens TaxID=981 RepID=A0AAN4W4Q2_9BACT|nr:hypothetical protein PEDI_51880 [Persicobacter diffluens]
MTQKSNEAPKFHFGSLNLEPAKIQDLGFLSRVKSIPTATLEMFLPFILKDVQGSYWNIAFPIRSPESEATIGMILKNINYHEIAEGSDAFRGLWIADPYHCSFFAQKVYIGNSVIEILSFFDQYKFKFDFKQSVFVSVPDELHELHFHSLKNYYPNASFISLFGNHLEGKLNDIKFACWVANKSLDINLVEEELILLYNDKEIIFNPTNLLSFNSFRKASGLKNVIKVIKPKSGSFNDDLNLNENESTKKKSHYSTY